VSLPTEDILIHSPAAEGRPNAGQEDKTHHRCNERSFQTKTSHCFYLSTVNLGCRPASEGDAWPGPAQHHGSSQQDWATTPSSTGGSSTSYSETPLPEFPRLDTFLSIIN